MKNATITLQMPRWGGEFCRALATQVVSWEEEHDRSADSEFICNAVAQVLVAASTVVPRGGA